MAAIGLASSRLAMKRPVHIWSLPKEGFHYNARYATSVKKPKAKAKPKPQPQKTKPTPASSFNQAKVKSKSELQTAKPTPTTYLKRQGPMPTTSFKSGRDYQPRKRHTAEYRKVYDVVDSKTVITAEQSKKLGPLYMFRKGDSNFFELKSGRTLCYATYGRQAGGTDLLMFHGMPGCRLEWDFLQDWAEHNRIRIIAVDRPGTGHSTPNPGKSVRDVVPDMEELLDHLEVDKFYVGGLSAGGAYAVACADYFSKERLLGTGIMCGVAPPEFGFDGLRMKFRLTRSIVGRLPRLLTLYLWCTIGKDRILSMMPGGDEVVRVTDLRGRKYQLNDKQCRNIEEMRQNPAGYIEEYHRINSPWKVRFGDIIANKITQYHGERDVNCPYRGAQWMHARFDQKKCPSNLVLEDLDDHFQVQKQLKPLLREVMSSKRW